MGARVVPRSAEPFEAAPHPWRDYLTRAALQMGGKKGDSHLLCEAPFGPFRQKVAVTFFGVRISKKLLDSRILPTLQSTGAGKHGGYRCAIGAAANECIMRAIELLWGQRSDKGQLVRFSREEFQ